VTGLARGKDRVTQKLKKKKKQNKTKLPPNQVAVQGLIGVFFPSEQPTRAYKRLNSIYHFFFSSM
jgi:type III secretion system FlhB-like substrate exporter